MDISIQAKTAPTLQLQLSKHANRSHSQTPRARYVRALQTHPPRACQLLNMGITSSSNTRSTPYSTRSRRWRRHYRFKQNMSAKFRIRTGTSATDVLTAAASDVARRVSEDVTRKEGRSDCSHLPITNDTTTAHRDLRLSLHAHLAGALKRREVLAVTLGLVNTSCVHVPAAQRRYAERRHRLGERPWASRVGVGGRWC